MSTCSGNQTLVYRLRNVSFEIEFDVMGRFRSETDWRRESEHLLKHSNDASEACDALKANETSLKPWVKRIYACVPDLCFTVVGFARFFGSKNGPYEWVARVILVTVLTRVRKFLWQRETSTSSPAFLKVSARSEPSVFSGLPRKLPNRKRKSKSLNGK